jgi:hypothetical protein
LATRVAIPISHQTLWSTGDVKLWADIDLLLKDAAGGLHPAAFRIDSATDLTTFLAYEAKIGKGSWARKAFAPRALYSPEK